MADTTRVQPTMNTDRTWFATRCKGDQWQQPHVERFTLTAGYLRENYDFNEMGMRVLEVGGSGPFTEWLQEHTAWTILRTNDTYDLRQVEAWERSHDAGCKLVLMMEVLEHIKDLDTSPRHCFDGSGPAFVLDMCRSALQPGGDMLLTTPNACGWKAIWLMLRAEGPRIYTPHVREYAPHELSKMIHDARLELVHLWTCDPWGHARHPNHARRSQLIEMMQRHELHGDDMFAVARRVN